MAEVAIFPRFKLSDVAVGEDFPRYHAIGVCHMVIKEIAGD